MSNSPVFSAVPSGVAALFRAGYGFIMGDTAGAPLAVILPGLPAVWGGGGGGGGGASPGSSLPPTSTTTQET